MSEINSKLLFRAVLKSNPSVTFYVRDNTDGKWDKYSALVLHEPVVLVGALKEKKYIVYPVSFAFFKEDWIVMLPSGVKDVKGKMIYDGDVVQAKDGTTVRITHDKSVFYAGFDILTPNLVKERHLQVIKLEVLNDK